MEKFSITIDVKNEKDALLLYLVFSRPNLKKTIISTYQGPVSIGDYEHVKSDFDYEDRNKICEIIADKLGVSKEEIKSGSFPKNYKN